MKNMALSLNIHRVGMCGMKEKILVYIYEQKVGLGLPGVSRLIQIYSDTNIPVGSKTFPDVKEYAQENTPNYNDSDGYYTLLEENESSVVVDQILSYQTYTKITRGGPQECYEPPCDWSDYENTENLIVNTYIPHTSTIFTVRAEMSGEVSNDEEKKKVNPTEEEAYLNTYRKILSTINILDQIILSLEKDFGGLFVSKNHVSFEFGDGSKMKDPDNFLEGTGKFRRHLKLKSSNDVKDKDVSFFVAQVVR